MTYPGEYPMMTDNEYKNAPWNRKDDQQTVDVIKSYSFDFSTTVEVPEGLEDNYELEWYYKQQYPSLEKIFEYLSKHFENPKDHFQRVIKTIADTAIVSDSFIDFN